MKTLFTLFAFVTFTFTGYARLGETMEQATARYGQVTGTDTTNGIVWYHFKKNGFLVYVNFQNDKAASICFVRDYTATKKSSAEYTVLSMNEVNNFLNANGTGWTDAGYNNWESENAVAQYYYNTEGNLLTWHWGLQIETRERLDQLNKQQAEKETENQKGF